jgi:hypothetical protein
MRNLENLETTELSFIELVAIDGGMIAPNWAKLWDAAGKVATAIGLADAVDKFVDGFNSVNCSN